MSGASHRLNLISIKVLTHNQNRRWSPGVVGATDPTAELYSGGVAVTLPGARWSLLITRRGHDPIRPRPLCLRGRCYVCAHRVVNRWRDLRAALAGYCNHRPSQGYPGGGGGYLHWRCALPAGHAGLHRARNYVWDAEGSTNYLPLPPGQSCDQPQDRHPTPTRRQSREAERWHRTRASQHRAERIQ